MFDLNAFSDALEDSRASPCVLDRDGLVVPELWRHSLEKWETLALPVREKFSANYVTAQKAKPPSNATRRAAATRFTTDYAVRWGRRKGWQLIDRERYDYRLKRHHDLMLGVDALMDDGNGLIGIQGAGKSERASHWERFKQRGGVAVAARRHIRIYYLEFIRESFDPVREEQWA